MCDIHGIVMNKVFKQLMNKTLFKLLIRLYEDIYTILM